ncbi:MAG: glycosyltransferase [Proteobacteria bacterium]|nr:glycosyltransferase [Pseudomonadota bacterium]
MTLAHNHFIKKAQDGSHKTGLIFTAPDHINGDGTYRKLFELASQGKRLVAMASLRLSKESMLQSLSTQFEMNSTVKSIGTRDLATLALKHLHSETKRLFWNAEEGSNHPSVLIWPVADKGLVIRQFHLHPLLVVPSENTAVSIGTIDSDYVQTAVPHIDDMYVIEDSDELCLFELSSEGPPPELTVPRVNRFFSVVKWAATNANQRHLEFVTSRIKIHNSDLDDSWVDTIAQSDTSVNMVLRRIGYDPANQSHLPPRISWMVMARNSVELLEYTLRSVRAQTTAPAELVIAHDFSESDLPRAMSMLQGQQIPCSLHRSHWNEKAAVCADINDLIARCRGEAVLITTDKFEYYPNFLHISSLSLQWGSTVSAVTSTVSENIQDTRETMNHTLHTGCGNGPIHPEIQEHKLTHQRRDIKVLFNTVVFRKSALLRWRIPARFSGFFEGLSFALTGLKSAIFNLGDVFSAYRTRMEIKELPREYERSLMPGLMEWLESEPGLDLTKDQVVAAMLASAPPEDWVWVAAQDSNPERFPLETLLVKATLRDICKRDSLTFTGILESLVRMKQQKYASERKAMSYVRAGFESLNALKPPVAVENFQTAVQMFPDEPAINFGLAAALLQVGAHREAETFLYKVLEHSKVAPDIIMQTGHLLLALNNRNGAIEAFKRSTSAGVKTVEPLKILTVLYLQSGQGEEAFDTCNLALQISPYDTDLLKWGASLYSAIGNTPEASRLMRRLDQVRQNPDSH